tara:strand:- start:712 stop:813 length:102 start_codon:yes stop_codon:yes gene_type:complete
MLKFFYVDVVVVALETDSTFSYILGKLVKFLEG